MKLKLDLHPIYNDSNAIESALKAVIDDAVEKRASEVEIIPGKGSGALKKSVLRFLDRPEVKARYHRIEKDADNWGRLFVHFRHDRREQPAKTAAPAGPRLMARCFCCGAAMEVEDDDESTGMVAECPACASPNRVHVVRRPGMPAQIRTEPGYE